MKTLTEFVPVPDILGRVFESFFYPARRATGEKTLVQFAALTLQHVTAAKS